MAFCLVLLSGCGVFVDMSAGAPVIGTRDREPPYGFAGEGAIVTMALVAERDYSDRLAGYCSFLHVSNSHSGWPFNDVPESSLNSVGCGFKFRLW